MGNKKAKLSIKTMKNLSSSELNEIARVESGYDDITRFNALKILTDRTYG